MKLRILIPCVAIAAMAMTSCKAVYRCGDPIPEKQGAFWSSRLKKVVNERDTLCADLSASRSQVHLLEIDTAINNERIREQDAHIEQLNDQNRTLTSDFNRLNKNYHQLQDEKLSQAESFNHTLKQKADELAQKEALLSEREKKMKELQSIISRQDSISKRLKDVLHNALMGFNSDELSVEMRNGKVYVSMSDKLLFKSGSTAVEEKGKTALKVLSEVLTKNPEIEILVEGHTDNVPIKTAVFKDNWDLSVARATSIVRILTADYGILPTRITASGRGEFFPRATNESSAGRALNRRTEIILSPKLDVMMEMLNNK